MEKILYSIIDALKATIFLTISAVSIIVTTIPILTTKIIKKICDFFKTRNFKQEGDEKDCCEFVIPEDILRRPDPCIYSQTFLQGQGLPVTWNNPDIRVAKAATPNIIEPDSYNLLENTHYIVSVQVHNASTDVALGVKVRLVYRPWSFNSPDLIPVEFDSNGNEVFKIVNIAGMSSSVVTFNWITPDVALGEEKKHFCLQAILYHPLDTNPSNNLGQENTNVVNLMHGQYFSISIPLFNPLREEQKFRLVTTQYQIDYRQNIDLKLKKNTGVQKENFADMLFRNIPSVKASYNRQTKKRIIELERTKRRTVTKAKYVGFEELRREMLAADISIPDNWQLKFDDYNDGFQLPSLSTQNVNLNFVVPNDLQRDTIFPLNVLAIDRYGKIAGGVTILIKI